MVPIAIARRIAVSALCLALASLAGCLERFEAITIRPDASALLRSEFRGTPDDFKKTADALPDAATGWTISEHTENDQDGKPRIVRVAELSLTPGAAFPDSYAAPHDPRHASGLLFPTTFKTIRTPEGTRFEFSRTYQRRDEAAYAYSRKKLTETSELKAMQGKDPSELTPEQRTLLLRSLARVEAEKQVRFIEVGSRALVADGTWPQHIPLLLRAAALDFASSFDISSADTLLRQPASPDRDSRLNQIAARFTSGLEAAVKSEFEKLHVPEDQRARFGRMADAEKTSRAATEDLSDERWEVRLTMPGTLIAHNADRVEDGALVWEFSADAIMDRDQVIRASSIVPQTK
ncbi:MAG TPA: hypothetical protein VHC70_15800 [Phycisphaerales bacterium]|nr:hypothetical protein [Phycisphaerales bacterium]